MLLLSALLVSAVRGDLFNAESTTVEDCDPMKVLNKLAECTGDTVKTLKDNMYEKMCNLKTDCYRTFLDDYWMWEYEHDCAAVYEDAGMTDDIAGPMAGEFKIFMDSTICEMKNKDGDKCIDLYPIMFNQPKGNIDCASLQKGGCCAGTMMKYIRECPNGWQTYDIMLKAEDVLDACPDMEAMEDKDMCFESAEDVCMAYVDFSHHHKHRSVMMASGRASVVVIGAGVLVMSLALFACLHKKQREYTPVVEAV